MTTMSDADASIQTDLDALPRYQSHDWYQEGPFIICRLHGEAVRIGVDHELVLVQGQKIVRKVTKK